MVRVKGKDGLEDLAGVASRDFGRADLGGWESRADLQEMYQAVKGLQPLESAFNSRARSDKPDLKKNLREAEHMAAIRAFNKAKERLPHHAAEHITRMIERDFDAARIRNVRKNPQIRVLH